MTFSVAEKNKKAKELSNVLDGVRLYLGLY